MKYARSPARDLHSHLCVLHVGDAPVDPAPHAGVDGFLERVWEKLVKFLVVPELGWSR